MLYTAGPTDCSPADVGYDESRVGALHRHFQRLIDEGKLQCASYCVSRHGKVFLHGAIGRRSYQADDGSAVRPDDLFFLSSLTKPFTATAIMQLVEDGLTRLDVAVGTILPQFATPPFDQIRLFHLLTHTSGMHPDPGCFPNKYGMSYWGAIERALMLHDDTSGEPFDWIKAALALGVRDKPGQQWRYCSFGYAVLGAIIEKLAGVKATTYIEEHIIAPLGLTDTFFVPPEEKRNRYIVSPESAEELALLSKPTLTPVELMWRDIIPSTAGGLSSTPYDINRFGNAFLNGGTLNGARILGRKAVEKMTTVATALPDFCWGADGTRRLYAIGFDMVDRMEFTYSEGTFCHEGSGFVQLIVDPREKMVSAVFVPFADPSVFVPEAVYGTQNVIWSGLI